MSRFFNRKYAALAPYVPGEQPQDMKYIKLNTNESPYPPAPAVLASLTAERLARLRLYPDPDCAALKKALAGQYGLSSANVYVANGSDDVLNFAFMAFAQAGGKVYFPDLTYGFYPVFAALNGLEAIEIPLKDDFSIAIEDYCGANGMVVIANPNAPTGLALELDDIRRLLEAHPADVVLIDEAYVDFGAESAVSLIGEYENLLVVQTYSKSRSMAGARLGFALGQEELIADLERLKYSTNPYNVSLMTQIAGVAAIEASAYYRECCQAVASTRRRTAAELVRRGFDVLPSLANFLFARTDAIPGPELYRELKEAGVLVRRFDKERIKDYNRITVGTDEEMDKFLQITDEIIARRSQ